MKRILVSASVALAVGAAIPAAATAHDFTIVCNNDDGRWVVTPDFRQLNPVRQFTDTGVTVTWSDGFTRTKPYPGTCVSPTPTTPRPTTPEVTPPPPAVELPPITMPPPTCAELIARYPKAGPVRRANWGCPAPPINNKPPKRPHITNRRIVDICVVGKRTRHITIVTLSNGKVGRIVRFGKICRLLPTTG